MIGGNPFQRKSYSDFAQEAEEFQNRKRERMLAEQLGNLQMKKLQSELDNPDLEKLANKSLFDFYQGKPLSEQGKAAIETLATMKGSSVKYEPNWKGEVVAVTEPNAYQQFLQGQYKPAQVPKDALPPGVFQDPMAASKAAVLQRQSEIGSNPYQNDVSFVDMNQDDVEQALGGTDFQRAMKQNKPVDYDLDPEVAASPYGRKLIFEQNLKSRDPKLQQELKEQQEKAGKRETSAAMTSGLVTQEINRALNIIQKDNDLIPATGTMGALTSFIGETDAGTLKNLLTTIKSNIGFDRLQRMREESPTGGALGNVSNFEVDNLQATRGSLAQNQRKDVLSDNLKRIYNQEMDIIHGTPEQIAIIGRQKGLDEKTIKQLSFRYPLGFEGKNTRDIEIESLIERYAD